MPNYLVMIYENDAAWTAADPAEIEANHQRHGAFVQANGAKLRGGARLDTRDTATSIRTNGAGETTVTDGTFVESKEVLGGYYLIEAADLDEALAIAQQVPAPYGGIEVRPVLPN